MLRGFGRATCFQSSPRRARSDNHISVGLAPCRPDSTKRNARDAVALGEQFLLARDIVRDRIRLTRTLMIEIPARRSCQFVFARGEPRLGYTPLMQIVRG